MSAMDTPKLLTDDMDTRDTKLSMYVGGNGDYYLELQETKRGKIIKIDTRIAMSGGNATTEIKASIANLFKALRGETSETSTNGLNLQVVVFSEAEVCQLKKDEYELGVEDGKTIAKHGTVNWQT